MFGLNAANKGYDVNIVGIRNSATGQAVTNLFDDRISVSYKENGNWIYKEWLCPKPSSCQSMMPVSPTSPA